MEEKEWIHYSEGLDCLILDSYDRLLLYNVSTSKIQIKIYRDSKWSLGDIQIYGRNQDKVLGISQDSDNIKHAAVITAFDLRLANPKIAQTYRVERNGKGNQRPGATISIGDKSKYAFAMLFRFVTVISVRKKWPQIF